MEESKSKRRKDRQKKIRMASTEMKKQGDKRAIFTPGV